MPDIFANELYFDNQLKEYNVLEMVKNANDYRNQLESRGEEIETIDCKLTSSNGEKYIIKAYPIAEPLLLNNNYSLKSSLDIAKEIETKTYEQTYVVEINDSSIYGSANPMQTDVSWVENGSVQAFSTVIYTEKIVKGNCFYRIDKATMGWNIIDSNTQISESNYKVMTCGLVGANSEGMQLVNIQQEKKLKSNLNKVSFNTDFADFTNPNYCSSIGTFQTCYINRANQGWQYFEFAHQIKIN